MNKRNKRFLSFLPIARKSSKFLKTGLVAVLLASFIVPATQAQASTYVADYAGHRFNYANSSSQVLGSVTPYMSPSKVLVVYRVNSSDTDGDGMGDSEQLARYYIQKRAVPQGNLLGLNISVGTNYQSSEYSKFQSEMVQPIKSKISQLGSASIDVILLAGNLPMDLGSISLDNALMGLNYWSASSNNIGKYSNPYFEPAPTFGTDKGHFSHSAYKFNNTDMYLVSRLGSDNPLRGIDQVDQSIYGDTYIYPSPGYYSGNAYVDTQYSSIPYPQTNWGAPYTDSYLTSQANVQSGSYSTAAGADMNIAYAEHYIVPSGFPLKWEFTTTSLQIGHPSSMYSDGTSAATAPRALFYGGWYNYAGAYPDAWEWLPGSIADDLNSGYYFGMNALSRGASAAMYSRAEPYLDGTHRPHVWYFYILQGYNFAEASALATPNIGWMETSEGDPLYAPMQPKTPVLDTQAPMLVSGYPKFSLDAITGNTIMQLAVDDSNGPEVAKATIEYGLDSSYGFVATSTPGYHRISKANLRWANGVTYHYRITLTDPVGNTTFSPDFIYTPASVETPFTGTPAAIPGTLEAENFDKGGLGVAYYSLNSCYGNAYRESSICIMATQDASGYAASNIYDWPAYEQWMDYTVNVAQSGNYTLQARVASPYTLRSQTFHLESDRVPVSGPITVPNTGGADIWQTIAVPNIYLTAGRHVLRLQSDPCNSNFDSPCYSGNINYLTFTNSGLVNAAPTIVNPAASVFNPSTTTFASLSVAGADDGGEATLAYTWSATGPAPVTFSTNGTNASKYTTANFTKEGTYNFTVTVTDMGGLTASSSVTIAVTQTPKSVTVSPSSVSLATGASQQFTAILYDQFAKIYSPQPSFTWNVTGGGSVSNSGLFTAGDTAGGPYSVSAASPQGFTGTASVTVIGGTTNDTTPPTAPANLAASNITTSSINLSWQPSSDNVGVSGYQVYRNGTLVITVPSTLYQDSGLAANTAYNYVVAAVDAAGNISPLSNPVSVTTLGGPVADTTAPAVSITSPDNNVILKGANVNINASATDNVKVIKMELYIDATFVTQTSVSSLTYRWNMKNVSKGIHTIVVRAYDAAGNIGSSSITVNK
jgi:chitodextrinase